MFNTVRNILFVSLVPFFVGNNACLADNFYRVPLNGKTISIPAVAGKKFTFFAESTGNLSSIVKLYSTVGSGAKLTVSAAKMVSSVEHTLDRDELFYPLTVYSENQSKVQNQKCVELGTDMPEDELLVSEFPPTSAPLCDAIPVSERKAIATQLGETFGGNWSLGNVCGYLVYLAGGRDFDRENEWCKKYRPEDLEKFGIMCIPDSPEKTKKFRNVRRTLRTATAQTLQTITFHKDACGSSGTQKYIFRIEVVLPKSYARNKPIVLSVYEYRQKKGKASLLKPESDGRYAPSPIVLMTYNGQSCGNRITAVEWKGNRPASKVSVDPYTLYLRNSSIYAIGVVSKLLSGGKGTIELSDNNNAYGVCFDLIRKRQEKNGYK